MDGKFEFVGWVHSTMRFNERDGKWTIARQDRPDVFAYFNASRDYPFGRQAWTFIGAIYLFSMKAFVRNVTVLFRRAMRQF